VNALISLVVAVASLTSPAAAQDADDLWEPSSLARIAGSSSPADDPNDFSGAFSIGPAAGYLVQKDADRGTWFGGVQARIHFAKILAAEASITFHQNRYEEGDVVVTQYPVQLTAFLYIIPSGPIRPYILGGVGWYYTKFQYDGLFSAINDRTEHIFGEHLGAGAELMLGKSASLDVDVRYIFLNPDTDQVIKKEFNYWQVSAGLNFFF
jgi:outer membrane protein W